jgi:beta-fructofuranosidase
MNPDTRLPSSDHQRPQYHFTAPTGWINDPNGVIALKRNGKLEYHLFYQYNPLEARWGNICWGHALSFDLVNWQDLPIALEPNSGVDENGCWSGYAVLDDQKMKLFYTGADALKYPGDTSNASICLAESDDFVHFTKRGRLLEWSEQFDLIGFRDPIVWCEDGGYLMSVGAGIRDVGGAVLLYHSSDLEHWTALEPLIVGNLETEPLYLGQVWECPQLLQFENLAVLMISVWTEEKGLYPAFLTGQYKDRKLIQNASFILDNGGSLYAPQVLEHNGRKIMFGWLSENRTWEAQVGAGWSGAMSLPRELTIKDGQFEQHPVTELEVLRGQKTEWHNFELQAETKITQGDSLEIRARFVQQYSQKIGFRLRSTPDSQEYTRVFVDLETGELVIDRSRSSLDQSVIRDERRMKLIASETFELRIFLDGSTLEVFTGGQAITTRIYPTQTNALEIHAFCEGGQGRLELLEIWEMLEVSNSRIKSTKLTP